MTDVGRPTPNPATLNSRSGTKSIEWLRRLKKANPAPGSRGIPRESAPTGSRDPVGTRRMMRNLKKSGLSYISSIECNIQLSFPESTQSARFYPSKTNVSFLWPSCRIYHLFFWDINLGYFHQRSVRFYLSKNDETSWSSKPYIILATLRELYAEIQIYK